MKAVYQVQQTKEFAIEDQVLYNDNLRYHRKLKLKWVGPWTIIEVLYNRSYKIADHVGIQAQPINNDHLKLYHRREDLQVQIEKYIKNDKSFNLKK